MRGRGGGLEGHPQKIHRVYGRSATGATGQGDHTGDEERNREVSAGRQTLISRPRALNTRRPHRGDREGDDISHREVT